MIISALILIWLLRPSRSFLSYVNASLEGRIIVGDEHVIYMTPQDTAYVKVGSDRAFRMWPDLYDPNLYHEVERAWKAVNDHGWALSDEHTWKLACVALDLEAKQLEYVKCKVSGKKCAIGG